MAGVFFFRYINSIQKIEKHMASNRPMEWEALGKPSIFSGTNSEENIKFKQFVDSDNPNDQRDAQLIILWERSKQLKHTLSVITWSAFGMYIFTIVAVRFLLNQIRGL